MAKIQKLKFREFSVVKMMVLEMQNSLTLISREISLAEKLFIFHTASKKHFYYFWFHHKEKGVFWKFQYMWPKYVIQGFPRRPWHFLTLNYLFETTNLAKLLAFKSTIYMMSTFMAKMYFITPHNSTEILYNSHCWHSMIICQMNFMGN